MSQVVRSGNGVEQVWSADIDGGDGLLAVVIRRQFSAPGVTFFTDKDSPQQVAGISHPEGHEVPAHVHHPRTRKIESTTEVLIVRTGQVRVDFYTSAGRHVSTKELRSGDVCLLCGGGHGLKFLTAAELWEVKQGPYFGRDLDKKELPCNPTND